MVISRNFSRIQDNIEISQCNIVRSSGAQLSSSKVMPESYPFRTSVITINKGGLAFKRLINTFNKNMDNLGGDFNDIKQNRIRILTNPYPTRRILATIGDKVPMIKNSPFYICFIKKLNLGLHKT